MAIRRECCRKFGSQYSLCGVRNLGSDLTELCRLCYVQVTVMKPEKPPVRDTKQTTRRRYWRITYSNARPDDDPKLFKDRDAMAFCELAAGLPQMGYDYATTIHLYPDDERKLTEFPPFGRSDVLVLTTRPPLHDKVGIIPSHRKVIHGAKTELEDVLFTELSKYVAYCTRKHVELSNYGAGCVKVAEPERWKHIELYEYSGAEILRHYVGPEPGKRVENHRSTIAFFLRANGIPGINCDFVASFGMDGNGTLIWNRLIRTRYPHWLASPRFVMAELIYKKQIPPKPLTPEFVDEGDYVEVRLLT